ncbi:MAG TPA: glycine zipper 2TM domain-containing protein [Gammaproteobacteria bacterium]|nr:glycine zipper 2TM domain-containing protein [Gammaproteobacteria bacterium]
MKTKAALLTSSLILTLLPAGAFADRLHHGGQRSFTDTARVVNVEPVYENVTTSHPERECWEEEVYYSDSGYDNHRDNTALNMIVGGALGGALGHNLGRHSDTAKIAGAVIGSAIGYDASRRHGRKHRLHRGTEERCQTVYEKETHEKLDGYRVTWRYHGQTFTSRMNEDPGSKIRVRVRLTPLD